VNFENAYDYVDWVIWMWLWVKWCFWIFVGMWWRNV